MIRVCVPRDTTACALGADAVADAIAREAAARGVPIQVSRTGSRGLFWLEPLIEVATEHGRIGYGPVAARQVATLFDAGFTGGGAGPGHLGLVEAIPYLRDQQRLTFARAGVIDPLSLAQYRDHGGFVALENALEMSSQAIVDAIKASGLRGRGGAAFPAGIKWQTVLDAKAAGSGRKYVVCNADEGDSGTFADRLLMEADPFQLIEAMVIAGLATGADRGFIYLRSEYPLAYTVLSAALASATQAGLLGPDVLGSGRAFDLDLRLGAGAYICGEETALLESLEGRRGLVRAKPPLPAIAGLFGQPTLIHNVLTLAAVTTILTDGPNAYRALGTGTSAGTVAAQLAGNIRRGGLVEVPFGTPLRELIEGYGGGTASGRAPLAAQVGGPLGAYLPESHWDLPLDYEALAEADAMLGHGGVVLFDDSADMLEQARFAMAFCAAESCGKCTPCRIGSVRGVELIDQLRGAAGAVRAQRRRLLDELCDTMADGSLCALGGLTPLPVRSILAHFADAFDA